MGVPSGEGWFWGLGVEEHLEAVPAGTTAGGRASPSPWGPRAAPFPRSGEGALGATRGIPKSVPLRLEAAGPGWPALSRHVVETPPCGQYEPRPELRGHPHHGRRLKPHFQSCPRPSGFPFQSHNERPLCCRNCQKCGSRLVCLRDFLLTQSRQLPSTRA